MAQWVKWECAAFLEGVDHLTMGERGAYATLLFKQETNPFKTHLGRMSEHMIKSYLKDEYEKYWPLIQHKFTRDNDGNWYNPRMERVILERMGRTMSGKNAAQAKWGTENDSDDSEPGNGQIEIDGTGYDIYSFVNYLISNHPRRFGTSEARRIFRDELLSAGPKIQETAQRMIVALRNYRKSDEVKNKKIMKVSRWAAEWFDWYESADSDSDEIDRRESDRRAKEIEEQLKKKGII